MKSFINAYQDSANTIKHIFIENGICHEEKVKFKPFLGIMTNEKTKWTDIFNNPLKVKVFDSITEMKIWKKENKGMFDIYGDVAPHIQFIASQYQYDIPLQTNGLVAWNIDIETIRDRNSVIPQKKGFPNPLKSEYPVSTITIQNIYKNEYIILGFKDDYYTEEKNVTYINCKDEDQLLKMYIKLFNDNKVRILTGWNTNGFDIPYLVNRTNKILGTEWMKKLSLDRVVKKQETTTMNGRIQTTYLLQGTICWDYLDLYKKYIGKPRESFKLNDIAMIELGEGKVSYAEEHETLENLYYDDFQTFVDYNKKDVELVYELNYKLRFIELALSIMYKAKCSPESIFGTVQPWDCIFYNELLKTKKLCPPDKHHEKEDFIGGYVKDTEPELCEWLAVYDIVSSYPNQIRSYNMSSETIIDECILPDELKDIKLKYSTIESCLDVEKTKELAPILQKYGVSFTCNGQFFRNDIDGFISSVYSKLFKERIQHKKDAKKAFKDGNKELGTQLDLIQYAEKILLNSGYGNLSNQHSRYYDIRIAEAITSGGQLSVRGAEKYIYDNLGIENKYCDTDSIFLKLEPLVAKRFKNKIPDKETVLNFLLKLSENVIEPKCNEFFEKLSVNMNMKELTIVMEAECIAEVSIMIAKKKYIMNKIWEEGKFYLDNPEQKVRGVEIVRTSTPEYCRRKLKEAVKLIFDTKNNDCLLDFIKETKKEFITLPFRDIAFPRGCNFSNYTLDSKGLPIAVRGALKYNDFLNKENLTERYPEISDGDKLKFSYIKVPNIIKSDVIAISTKFPEEWKDKLEIDYDLQFQKSFVAPLQNIFKAIGWETEKKYSLDDFFS